MIISVNIATLNNKLMAWGIFIDELSEPSKYISKDILNSIPEESMCQQVITLEFLDKNIPICQIVEILAVRIFKGIELHENFKGMPPINNLYYLGKYIYKK